MIVVDVHYHLMPLIPDDALEVLVEDPIRATKTMGKKVERAEFLRRAKEGWPDPDGERLLRLMEEEGVDFTVICAVDNAASPMFTPELVSMQNQAVADVARKHPDKVMALAGVDPRRENAPDLLRRCFEEFGMKGLKYHADYGYDPCGPESYRLLEIVQENCGILLTHTGPLTPPARPKYAEPTLLSDLAVDFPDLRVIAAHMGLVNWRPWAALAAQQPNLYGDLAAWDALAFGHYELFCRELRDLIDYAGIEKVLFGTDNPIFQIVRPTREWIDLIRNLPTHAPPGISFTREEVDAILGGNAAALLGLSVEKAS